MTIIFRTKVEKNFGNQPNCPQCEPNRTKSTISRSWPNQTRIKKTISKSTYLIDSEIVGQDLQ